MASHFSDLGFRITEDNFETEIKRIVEENIGNAAKIDFGKGPYLVVPVDNLIELWFPFENNMLDPYSIGLHYQTGTFLEVENVEWVQESDGGYDGLCYTFLPDCYPINVTVPAPKLLSDFVKEKRYKCQIACFAEDISVFVDAEDFHARCPYGKEFSENVFIPSGTFHLEDEEGALSSRAIIAGTVKSFERRTNSFSGNDYYSITVETFGSQYDLLVDPDLLPNGISVGNIIYGYFWLSGKIMSVFHGDELIDLQREKNGNPNLQTLGDLYHVLRHCWTAETAYPSCKNEWSKKDCTYGQCAITAMLVHDMFGGTIHKVRKNGSTHYFKKINGHYVDLTSEQFEIYSMPVDYENSTEVDRIYCGTNPDTKKRFDLLVKRVSEYLKTLE